MESWSNTPPQQPEKQVNKGKLPEGAPQQEFFATEFGTVAGRDTLENLEKKADRMLADREKSIDSIGESLQKSLQEAQKELILRKGVRETDLEIFAGNPNEFNADFQTRESDEFKKRINEIERRIETLSNLTQKLEHGSLSTEEAKLVVEWLPRNEQIVTHMFLTRLSSQSTEDRLKESKRQIDRLNIKS